MAVTTDQESSDRFVLLATMGDLGMARVFAARLESEGIEARLHGEALGPYPVTLGKLAETQIWVPASRLEPAQEVMLEAEVADTLGGVEEPAEARRPAALTWQIVAAGVVAILVAIAVRVL